MRHTPRHESSANGLAIHLAGYVAADSGNRLNIPGDLICGFRESLEAEVAETNQEKDQEE